MVKVKVRCSYIVDIELDEKYHPTDDSIKFYVEENHCPGTGSMGLALEEVMEKADEEGVCWACNLQGQCEIIEITR